MRQWRGLAVTMLLSAGVGAASVMAMQPAQSGRQSDELLFERTGAICAFAILAVASEAGRRCASVRSPAFHAQLETEIGRLADHIARTNGASPEAIAGLRRDQGNHDAPDAHVCSEFPLEIWRRLQAQGQGGVRRAVDELIARPGPAIWGDCL